MKDPKKVAMGKKSKAAGTRFESKVRKDLEEKGWIVSKWMNQVDFVFEEENGYVKGDLFGKLIPAKHKFRGMGIPMSIGTGFPDFVAFQWGIDGCNGYADVIGVESKMNGYLDKAEKEKCKWLLDNKIFSKILIGYAEQEIKTKCFWCDKYFVDLIEHCKKAHPECSPRSHGETKEGIKVIVKYKEFVEKK